MVYTHTKKEDTSISLHDIDKNNGGRIVPTPNSNDDVMQRMAQGTGQVQNSGEEETDGLRFQERQILAVQDGVNKAAFGFYGAANKFGFKVAEDGTDVLEADDDQLIFNSEQNVFKIKSTDTVILSAPAAGSAYSTYIEHGLSYVPVVFVYTKQPNDTTFTPTPNISFTGAGTLYQRADVFLSTTRLTFQVENSASVGGSDLGTWTFKYYILQETVN